MRCTKRKLSRCHHKVRNVRQDAVHELTTELATTYGIVVVEDLNVKGMTASPAPVHDAVGGYGHNGATAKAGLNRSVLDACPGEVLCQLAYKLCWHQGTLVVAPRFFPSSKRCSSCGETKAKLLLEERTYRCEHCALVIDRDLNAALNLAAYGRRELHVAGSGPETRNARGGALLPVKREDASSVTVSTQVVAA